MSKASLLVTGLVLVVLVMPIQSSLGSVRALDVAVGSDGTARVSSEVAIDPADPRVVLYGSAVDNFVAVDGAGTSLPAAITGEVAVLESAPDSTIMVLYDVHDLVSKKGRTWTFSFDSPTPYTMLMPENSVIVYIDAVPSSTEVVGGQIKFGLDAGPAKIDYVFGSPANVPQQPDYGAGLVIGLAAAAGTAVLAVLWKKQGARSLHAPQDVGAGPESVFNSVPEMREDDKEIVRFIYENSGQVLESDLRKKFLQPRTTMWRAVKRLERLGIVEIHKKDQQNMVKLKQEAQDG